MSRSPNAEQLLAIEHQGGVLLRAGAGSGKTFVLVHHILYLTGSWISEFKKSSQGSFEEFLRLKFSQVVMMTFTKKAAGEMSIRLTEKFEEMALKEGEEQSFWMTANEALPMLTVTTIDGFCRKLITQGYFPHLSTEAKIIFDTERTDQVNELVEEWFLGKSSSVPADLLDIIIREKRAILSAFTHVFSDPGLRLAWKKFNLSEIHPDKLDKVISQSFILNDMESALAKIHHLDLDQESSRSAFEKVVASFQASGLPVVDSVEKLGVYEKLFEPIKILSGERTASKKSPSSEAAKDGLVALRTWIKNWAPVISEYKENFESKILPWMNLCLDIFNFIEEKMDPNQGMTFGDIEYFVSLGLENPVDKMRIQKNFNYFIVDEFQDTSDIQFQIIRGLIGDDFKKLFCVGDAKQAIYGFRGGELSVFQGCAELVPTVRSLANNYRSLPEVIAFNNSLFRTILPLGYNFEGTDPFSVDAEDQNVPQEVEDKESGAIEIFTGDIEWDSDEEKKLKTEDLNRLEAIVIADSIKQERQRSSNVCTVLYSKLRPSGELIRALMERGIGFTAQFKIDLLDDPLLGIFVTLLKRQFDQKEHSKSRFPLFLIKSYLKTLGIEREVTEDNLNVFDQSLRYWGLAEAYRKFIFSLHITNENSDLNFEMIETISELYYQDPEAVMNQLMKGDNDRLSLELRSGDESHKVQIMSAHASKGLEFDCVYLGGIYTNGKDQGDGSLFGDLPGSFQWYSDLSSRDKHKSPFYIHETDLGRYKNFSEAKRLFYVACTRAKKKLIWVDFAIPDKAFSVPQNSWILGLRAWLQNGCSKEKVTEIKIPDFNSTSLLKGQSLPQLPLFFHDPVGIFSKGGGDAELLIAAELSVTKLNSLIDCPRKFYFSHILKLTPPGTQKVQSRHYEDDELADVIRSSSERGTLIHEKISEGISRNFVVPRSVFGTELEKPVAWALELLQDLEPRFEFLSEKEIKFEFFNFMISGIPDLVLLPKANDKTQVWDFKTGRITQDKLSHYWLQLSAYAYALYELNYTDPSQEIELVLCFVDQEKTLTETVTFASVAEKLYPLWRSQNEPWRTNPDHCTQCSYGSICPR